MLTHQPVKAASPASAAGASPHFHVLSVPRSALCLGSDGSPDGNFTKVTLLSVLFNLEVQSSPHLSAVWICVPVSPPLDGWRILGLEHSRGKDMAADEALSVVSYSTGTYEADHCVKEGTTTLSAYWSFAHL